MSKIVPIRENYENVHALLAAIGDEPGLTGFAGAILLDDGTMIPVTHGLVRTDLALVGAVLQRLSTELDSDNVDSSRG